MGGILSRETASSAHNVDPSSGVAVAPAVDRPPSSADSNPSAEPSMKKRRREEPSFVQKKQCKERDLEHLEVGHTDGANGQYPAVLVQKPVASATRDARDLEVPVRAAHRLRCVRGTDGVLSLETNGVALYEDAFIARLAGSASVLAGAEPDYAALDATGRKKAPAGHAAQLNFLQYDLRRALRKHQIEVPRTEAVQKAYSSGKTPHEVVLLAAGRKEDGVGEDSDKRIGAFGKPEKRKVDVRGKILLAPLTTNGNLPFRILNKTLGVDITCGEMALAENLLKATNSEWALLRRHRSEDVFGVQLCGNNEATVARAAEIVARECEVDFIDLNAGCPIDLVFKRGAGCSLMSRTAKFTRMVAAMSTVVDVPLSVKVRMGVDPAKLNAHNLIPQLARSGAAWVTVHGRTRAQRYSRAADWSYIQGPCALAAREAGVPLVGNGDIYTWRDAAPYLHGGDHADVGIDGVMLARGSLIKPWLATEIKERRDWDISSSERLELYKDFCRYGLDHWGADRRGVETTRKFLLEWLSFAYRYVPVGLLEVGVDPVSMAHRAPYLRGRNDLETLFASHQSTDWVRISEMLLGPTPPGFSFKARHKSNAWGSDVALNG